MKIKLLSENATIPTRGTEYSAGYDLYSAVDIIANPKECTKIPTNIAMEIPIGYFGAVYSRSGFATKHGLRVAQGTAVIDADYRGDIIVPLFNDSVIPFEIKKGDRIAQIVFQPFAKVDFEVTDELEETERGTGGFGSTGS